MKVQERVLEVWKLLSRRERCMVRSQAKVALDATLRNHCKIILSLVAGNGARGIAKSGLCSTSQVYRVAERFVDQGPPGLVDQREDNGQTKADEFYQSVLLEVVGGSSPRQHGYRRPTWTQELLVLVLEKRTGVRVTERTFLNILAEQEYVYRRPKHVLDPLQDKAVKARAEATIEELKKKLNAPRSNFSLWTKRR